MRHRAELCQAVYFYPRPPRGGRLAGASSCQIMRSDFYPRPPRGGRLRLFRYQFIHFGISIHALREEGDLKMSVKVSLTVLFLSTPSARRATQGQRSSHCSHQISIHALREEGDISSGRKIDRMILFLSTPSARRATFPLQPVRLTETFLSTPSARRATWLLGRPVSSREISIHALREEGDAVEPVTMMQTYISIHALREEGDSKNGEKHLRFCFIIKRSAQIWKSLSKNIRENSCDLHRTA